MCTRTVLGLFNFKQSFLSHMVRPKTPSFYFLKNYLAYKTTFLSNLGYQSLHGLILITPLLSLLIRHVTDYPQKYVRLSSSVRDRKKKLKSIDVICPTYNFRHSVIRHTGQRPSKIVCMLLEIQQQKSHDRHCDVHALLLRNFYTQPLHFCFQ